MKKYRSKTPIFFKIEFIFKKKNEKKMNPPPFYHKFHWKIETKLSPVTVMEKITNALEDYSYSIKKIDHYRPFSCVYFYPSHQFTLNLFRNFNFGYTIELYHFGNVDDDEDIKHVFDWLLCKMDL